MKLSPLPAFALFACFAVASPAADPSPADNATPLPTPPMQGKPWTPPETNLPPVVVSAIKELFDQGMADPRGCEYREVEIDYPNPYHQPTTIYKFHAWMLPGDGKTHNAVGWNGRVVEVTRIGEPADLKKDVTAMVGDQGNYNSSRYFGDVDYSSDTENYGSKNERVYQRGGLSEQSLLPLKTALLLRIGEAKLARTVWNADRENTGDPYLVMAQEWLMPWYDAAIKAHVKGDNLTAMRMFRTLLPIWKNEEAIAERRGIQRPDANEPFISKLSQLPELIADQERRAKEPPYTAVLQSGTPAQGPERIAALIRDMELVEGTEMMSPGDNNPSDDPIVGALVQEGEPAVEALIACLEEDPPRLTHTMYSYRFRFQGPMERVYEPAFIALCTILKTNAITVPMPRNMEAHELSLDARKALAANFRAYWAKYKSMPVAERWYAILNDDHAAPRDWFDAAANIVRAENTFYEHQLFTQWYMEYSKPGPSDPMLGEPLRAKANPTVSELIIKRFNQMLPLARPVGLVTAEDPAYGGADITYRNLSYLMQALADWDGKNCLGEIKAMQQQINAKFPNQTDYPTTNEITGELFIKRAAQGDPTVFQEYADWVDSLAPKTSSGNDGKNYGCLYSPVMWQHADNPVIQKLSEKIYTGQHSPWIPVTPKNHYNLSLYSHTELLGLPAFRKLIVQCLKDKTTMGTIRIKERTEYMPVFKGERDNQGESGVPKVNFRVCDYYAHQLAVMDNFPVFNFLWPEKKRDETIAIYRRLIQDYGGDFQVDPKVNGAAQGPPLCLPRLDRPATRDDVAQGRAIFSLSGNARSWPMPAFPLYANRPSSKQDPYQTTATLANGESKPETIYTTDGSVWQAEEELVDGKWIRYYGFSGRHQLEKVRATEIEFPADGTWTSVGHFLDGKLEFPKTKAVMWTGYPSYSLVDPDAPLIVTVKVRNRSGLDQPVPGALVPPDDTGKTLPAGVSFTLSHTDKIPPELLDPHPRFVDTSLPAKPIIINLWSPGKPVAPFDYGIWSSVPARKEIQPAPARPEGPPLAAANELTIAQTDLRNYFDFSRPGSYRVKAIFHMPGEPAANSFEYTFSVLGKAE